MAALVLCCLTVSLFAPAVNAYGPGSGITGGYIGASIQWKYENETATYTGNGSLYGSISEFSPSKEWVHSSTRTVVLGEGITGLYDYTFMGAYDLTTVYIPESMEYIDTKAFQMNSRITDVYYAGAPGRWEDLGFDAVFPDTVQIHFAKEDVYSWQQVGNTWYCYRNGVIQTGWVLYNSKWYYLDSAGAMAIGWKQVNGQWYYFDGSGVMLTGWQDIGNHRFYLGTDGVMADKNTYIDGVWYRFDENGHFLGRGAGWSVKDGKTYYLLADGSEAKGWQKINGYWYFFESDGVMATNVWKKDSKGWCYLTEKGAMLVNGWAKDTKGWCYVGADGYCISNAWAKDSVGWCYLGSDCRMVISAWVQYKGCWYYLDENGYMVTGHVQINDSLYIFDGSGKMFANTFIVGSGRYYYASANGALCTGWNCLDGDWYYFYQDGHMAKDTYIDNHYVDDEGINTSSLDKETLINFEYGASKAESAQADKRIREIAQDALTKGGETDYDKVMYAAKQLSDLYHTNRRAGIALGAEASVAGPVLYDISLNDSDAMAMSRILTYMGYENVKDGGLVYLKMDGEYGWVRVYTKEVAYGNPSDIGTYKPLNSKDEPVAVSGTWYQNQNKWYYKTANGKNHVGWLYWKDRWYYMGTDGSMKTGWLSCNSNWYYLSADGSMKTGWLTDNGKKYYLQENGVMITGKFFADGQYYFADYKGVVRTGWVQENGKWYYMDSTGAMAFGKKTVNGVDYCFNEDGQMLVGWFQDYHGNWYYAQHNGVLLKGWQQINGTYYYFYKDYHMAAETYIDRYYVNEKGAWVYSAPVDRDPRHYWGLTDAQAAQADAFARAIADKAMAQGTTAYEKVQIAAQMVQSYVANCSYQNDANGYYRSPYGVFVGGVFTCAGATRAMGRVLEFMGYEWYHPGEDQWDHQWVCVKIDGEYAWIDVQKSGLYMGFGNLLDNYNPY